MMMDEGVEAGLFDVAIIWPHIQWVVQYPQIYPVLLVGSGITRIPLNRLNKDQFRVRLLSTGSDSKLLTFCDGY
jgi:hypothetical protein